MPGGRGPCRVIGIGNRLPWNLPADLRHFKRVTMGKPVIMGRKTWESLPRKPLPGRPNIVVTRDEDFVAEGAEVFTDVAEAVAHGVDLARQSGADEVAVIGGAQIYAETIDACDRLYITEVHATPEGDTYFPDFDRSEWHEVSRERHEAGEKDSAAYSFVTLEK